jgi:hypothetical protein
MALEDEDSPTLHGSSPGGILGGEVPDPGGPGAWGYGEVYRAFDLKLRKDLDLFWVSSGAESSIVDLVADPSEVLETPECSISACRSKSILRTRSW